MRGWRGGVVVGVWRLKRQWGGRGGGVGLETDEGVEGGKVMRGWKGGAE